MRINYCPENLCILRSEFVQLRFSLPRFASFLDRLDANEAAAVGRRAERRWHGAVSYPAWAGLVPEGAGGLASTGNISCSIP